jgi:endoglucanase
MPIAGVLRPVPTESTSRSRTSAAGGGSGAPTGSGSGDTSAAARAGLVHGRSGVGLDSAAALELTIAANSAEPYKSRLKELFPQMITPEQMDRDGWKAVRA